MVQQRSALQGLAVREVGGAHEHVGEPVAVHVAGARQRGSEAPARLAARRRPRRRVAEPGSGARVAQDESLVHVDSVEVRRTDQDVGVRVVVDVAAGRDAEAQARLRLGGLRLPALDRLEPQRGAVVQEGAPDSAGGPDQDVVVAVEVHVAHAGHGDPVPTRLAVRRGPRLDRGRSGGGARVQEGGTRAGPESAYL